MFLIYLGWDVPPYLLISHQIYTKFCANKSKSDVVPAGSISYPPGTGPRPFSKDYFRNGPKPRSVLYRSVTSLSAALCFSYTCPLTGAGSSTAQSASAGPAFTARFFFLKNLNNLFITLRPKKKTPATHRACRGFTVLLIPGVFSGRLDKRLPKNMIKRRLP